MKSLVTGIVVSTALMAGTQVAQATPFSSCPSEAFLVQNQIAEIFGVKLATGYYQRLSNDMGTANKINGVGFSFHDNYLYGWTYEHQSVARIGADYQIEALPISNNPGLSFYVGDVALNDNAYYMYRKKYGLYRVGLDESQRDYLVTQKVVDDQLLALDIFDMAFHPTNGWAYSVTKHGDLYRFDTTGRKELLGNTGVSGTFGAVYFDVEENLYISRNSDGHIFRIRLGAADNRAELFAFGPSSSNNDGARCAMAPVIPEDAETVDFGDAPASYGTLAADNGARHDIAVGSLFLGNRVDGEPDANGLQDDSDDDGVTFLSTLEVDQLGIVEVNSSATGYLNAWIDFDGNGRFDDDELTIANSRVETGSNRLRFSIPAWAEAGETWARFRLSSERDLGPVGGVSDGEVEDYPVVLSEPNTTVVHYPSKNGWATLAFEDNWPLVGDYDFTDLVVNYRIALYQRVDPDSGETSYSRVRIEGQIAALGASFHNGLAFRLPGIARSWVNEDAIRFQINSRTQASPLEAGRDEMILVVADDLWDYVTPGEGCKYYRTEAGCGSSIQMSFAMTASFHADQRPAELPAVPFDPFVFATEGHARNYVFGMPPGRAYEIHMKGMAPTEAARTDFFGRGDDASNPAFERYYENSKGMPWVINVGEEWRHPLEYMDVLYAYPKFESYIQSGGEQDRDWYAADNAVLKNTFSD